MNSRTLFTRTALAPVLRKVVPGEGLPSMAWNARSPTVGNTTVFYALNNIIYGPCTNAR